MKKPDFGRAFFIILIDFFDRKFRNREGALTGGTMARQREIMIVGGEAWHSLIDSKSLLARLDFEELKRSLEGPDTAGKVIGATLALALVAYVISSFAVFGADTEWGTEAGSLLFTFLSFPVEVLAVFLD